MNAGVAVVKFQPRMRSDHILKALGLPRGTRWGAANQALKLRMAAAMRLGDEAELSRLGEAKACLKRTLVRDCSRCGLPTRRTRCSLCAHWGSKKLVQPRLAPEKVAEIRRRFVGTGRGKAGDVVNGCAALALEFQVAPGSIREMVNGCGKYCLTAESAESAKN